MTPPEVLPPEASSSTAQASGVPADAFLPLIPPAAPSEAAVRPQGKGGKQSVESVLKNRWARLLIPSLSDLFFVAALCWLFMGAYGWTGLIADGDVGWHIRTGEHILRTGSVPHHDLYSFSKPGAPWYAWEWLSGVIDALLFRWAGLKGVVLVAGVLIALFSTTLVRRIMRRGTNMLIAMVVSLLGVGSASMHFLARPHVYTLLLLSVSMWFIEKDRDGDAPPNRLWWLVPIALVWTNLHGGFLVLVAVLGLATLGIAAETLLGEGKFAEKDWKPALRYGSITAACALVSLVNPYGWGLHRHVIEYLRSDWIRNVVQEFQSPSFRNENMMQFEVLLFSGLIAAGMLLRRRRIAEGLWILFFAYLSLSSVRHVPVFVAINIPIVASEISGWWQSWTAQASKNSLPGILNQMAADSAAGFRRTSAWPFALIVALALINQPIKWPKDFPKELFPTGIIHAHENELLHAKLLTTDQWADYLIYLHPEQKVFVDGRSDFYGPEIGNQYLHLFNGQWDWKQVLDRYHFDMALVPVDQPIAQLLKQGGDWRVIADDGKSILLVPKATSVPSTSIRSQEPRF